MDREKYTFFLAKYRAESNEELQETSARLNALIDEAAEALRQVLSEKGIALPPANSVREGEERQFTPEARASETKLSTELWNGPLSKRVQYQFQAQALIFSFAFLGPQGLRVGLLWVVLFAAALGYVANNLGRRYTRYLCANVDRSIEEKRKSLKSTSLALWPVLLVSTFLGVVLASALRGA